MRGVFILVVLYLIFCSTLTFAGDLSINLGVGNSVIKEDENSTSGKIVGVGYALDLPKSILLEMLGGAFNADNVFNSKYTYWAALNLGVDVKTCSGLYMKVGSGPAYISKTNDRLGTNFQFLSKVGLGLYNKDAKVGVFYGHFSNGGISETNAGHDYLGLELGWLF
jgi:hypothetical protein